MWGLSCPDGGMVDTGDLKSPGREAVPVRVRLRVRCSSLKGPSSRTRLSIVHNATRNSRNKKLTKLMNGCSVTNGFLNGEAVICYQLREVAHQ